LSPGYMKPFSNERTGKHPIGLSSVLYVLLNTEVVHAQIEVQRRCHAHRAQIRSPMRTCSHLVQLRQGGDLSQVRDAARVDHGRANESMSCS
jgi:hypothetical protein